MAGTLIDIVMQDLSFLDDAQKEMAIQEQPNAQLSPSEQPQKNSLSRRLLGFMQLLR